MWREAWKYGERAFRYCQLDVGHAVGALAYAAALLGWAVRPLAVPGETLGALLGLDRAEDFPPSRYAFTENEEAGNPAAIEGPGLQPMPALSSLARAAGKRRPGRANRRASTRRPAIAGR
jgi:nitroreductase